MTKTATRTKVGTNFRWKPLIEIPEVVPSITLIDGPDAEAFLEEYNGRVDADYDGHKNLKVLSLRNGIVVGSNSFIGPFVDQMMKPQGIRVATTADLEKAIQTRALNLRGTYEDAGVVLRDEREPNSYSAQNLAEQVRARGMKVGKTPLVVPSRDLEVVRDDNSPYGLAFKLTEESQIIEARLLAEKYNGKRFKRLDENGMPIFDEDGDRANYNSSSGLLGLFLDGDLSLGSDLGGLAGSYEGGRVVLVRGEATDADFLRNVFNKKNSELSVKLERAQEILRAGTDEAYQKAVKSLQ